MVRASIGMDANPMGNFHPFTLTALADELGGSSRRDSRPTESSVGSVALDLRGDFPLRPVELGPCEVAARARVDGHVEGVVAR